MSSTAVINFIKHDDYRTPNIAWEQILHLLDKTKIIYEPFYLDGESGKYLTSLGLNVIHKNIDFYKYVDELNYDYILSNPPFDDTKNILNKLLEVDKPFILLMPVSKLNTQYMREYKNKLQLIIPEKRIHFIKIKDGEIINTKNCPFDCFYYCYKMGFENDIMWL
tara:strand:+ start:77 stop:571 length:495 start_codon:yes stop_codon:yes gene_type:complete